MLNQNSPTDKRLKLRRPQASDSARVANSKRAAIPNDIRAAIGHARQLRPEIAPTEPGGVEGSG